MKTTTMTIEKAAEFVNRATVDDRPELFCHFEELLNPHPSKIKGEYNEKAADWQEMFAAMCGFGIARGATTVE